VPVTKYAGQLIWADSENALKHPPAPRLLVSRIEATIVPARPIGGEG
jgi:hypothetical protein